MRICPLIKQKCNTPRQKHPLPCKQIYFQNGEHFMTKLLQNRDQELNVT